MPAPKNPDKAQLDDMLKAARLIQQYMKGVSFEEFWADNEKRDAVAMRLTVMGEAAARISTDTQKAFPTIAFPHIRGLRNRIAHDYGAIDFKVVWDLTQTEIRPLIAALEGRTKK